MAAFWPNLFVIVTGLIIGNGRMKIREVLDCLEWGTKNALAIGAACAAVGFIVGTVTLTGLGLKFASATVDLASGTAAWFKTIDFLHFFALSDITLVALLAYTAIASLILGMGLPTTPNYIVVSIIAAPALLKFGIVPLVSHMFVFYYGILADLTPPVAVAAYAAAGISQGDPFKTGVRSFLLAFDRLLCALCHHFQSRTRAHAVDFVQNPHAFPLPRLFPRRHHHLPGSRRPWRPYRWVLWRPRRRSIERISCWSTSGFSGATTYLSTIVGTVLLVGLYFYQRRRRIKRDGPYNKPKAALATREAVK